MLKERRKLKEKARKIESPYKPYWTKERIRTEINLVEAARELKKSIEELPENERKKILEKQNINLSVLE